MTPCNQYVHMFYSVGRPLLGQQCACGMTTYWPPYMFDESEQKICPVDRTHIISNVSLTCIDCSPEIVEAVAADNPTPGEGHIV